MLKRIKEYIQYRRNKKITKRELAKISAAVLPAFALIIKEVTDKLAADQNQ